MEGGSDLSTTSSSPSSPEEDHVTEDLKDAESISVVNSLSRKQLMAQRGRAFTFPDIEAPIQRARPSSERAEENDQVRLRMVDAMHT